MYTNKVGKANTDMGECLDDHLLLSRSLSLNNRDRDFFSSFDLTEADTDFMAGLTAKLARSTLIAHSYNAKGMGGGRSPMSTWKEPSPAATWDILYKAAGMRNPIPTVKTHQSHPGFYQRRLQAAKLELLRQQSQSGHVRRGTTAIGARPPPPPPPPQHTQPNGYSVYAGAKRECAGTGVFLPRRNVAAPKKPGCSVIVPARVARALNLNLEEMGGHPQVVNGRIGRGRFEHPPQPGRKHEICLPQEWTY